MITPSNLRERWLPVIRTSVLGGGISLPMLLLLLALSTVFIFGNDRGHFYHQSEHWLHNALTSNNLTLAANLSLDHNLATFHSRNLDREGNVVYDLYSRFPIGGYILLKLVILPFGNDLSAQIYAARTLMLLLFAATAVLVYLSLSRIVSNRWIALTATLLAFSSYYSLYYSETVATDYVMDLFAVMLTFHGIVIFAQTGHIRQLLLKMGVMALLGWHGYMLLAPFIVMGLGSELIAARQTNSALPLSYQLRSLIETAFRSRYVTIGVVAAALWLSIWTYNLGSEWIAAGGETSLTELPTWKSILYRTGFDEEFDARFSSSLEWLTFLKEQFYRIGGLTVPYALPGYTNMLGKDADAPLGLQGFVIGYVVFGASLFGLLWVEFTRWKTLTLMSLLLAGFCWALPMRRAVAFHDIETIFHIGIPLVFFTLVLWYMRRASRNSLIMGAAMVAAGVFIMSAYQISQAFKDKEATAYHETMMTDFENIRRLTKEKTVFIPQASAYSHEFTGARQSTSYYLSGSVIVYRYADKRRDLADFVILSERVDGAGLLTPHNQLVFLYDADIYYERISSAIRESGELIISSDFDVYLHEDRLTYIKTSACRWDDIAAKFFLHIEPVDADDLPSDRTQHGFNNLDFDFYQQQGLKTGDLCFANIPLPDYDIAAIRTGQFVPMGDGYEHLWRSEIRFDE